MFRNKTKQKKIVWNLLMHTVRLKNLFFLRENLTKKEKRLTKRKTGWTQMRTWSFLVYKNLKHSVWILFFGHTRTHSQTPFKKTQKCFYLELTICVAQKSKTISGDNTKVVFELYVNQKVFMTISRNQMMISWFAAIKKNANCPN